MFHFSVTFICFLLGFLQIQNNNKMRWLRSKLQNTLVHLIAAGSVNRYFYFSVHVLCLLQTLSVIVPQTSYFYYLVFWSEPSTYLNPKIPVVIGIILIVSYLILFIVRFVIVENSDTLKRPSLVVQYVGNVMVYIQIILETILVVPLWRGSQCLFKQHQHGVGVAARILYFCLFFPIVLYVTANTTVLTPQLNNKTLRINVQNMLYVARICFATCAQNRIMKPVSLILYLICYIIGIVKDPIFTYTYNRFQSYIASCIIFLSITTLSNYIFPTPNGAVLVQLFGTICFAALVQIYTNYRSRKILQLEQPTVRQFRILIYMAGQFQCYQNELNNFIIRHHGSCKDAYCKCSEIIDSFNAKQPNKEMETLWYKFIVSFINYHFNLEQMKKLNKTYLENKISKYYFLIFDLAEIDLFKLKKANQAYLIIRDYQSFLEKQGLESYWNSRKFKLIVYYIEEFTNAHCKTTGAINIKADQYVCFQRRCESYLRLLISTAQNSQNFWSQMKKRQPDENTLHNTMMTIQHANCQIRKKYTALVKYYEQSKELVDQFTNDYFYQVLNISPDDACHVIEPSKVDPLQEKKITKLESFDQNIASFSWNSETPICQISVQNETLGLIKDYNTYFQKVMNILTGKLKSIDAIFVPQLRQRNLQQIKKNIKKDILSWQLQHQFILTQEMYLLSAKMLVQIVPSLTQGLRYVLILRRLIPERKIFAVLNKEGIKYRSKSFEEICSTSIDEKELLTELNKEKEETLNQKIIRFEQYTIKLLINYTSEQDSLYFFQLFEGQLPQMTKPTPLAHTLFSTLQLTQGNKGTFFRNNKNENRTVSKNNLNSDQFSSRLKKNLKSSVRERNAAQKTFQKQRQQRQNIAKTFKGLVLRKQPRKLFYARLLPALVCIPSIALIIACLVVKKNHQMVYFNALENSVDFYELKDEISLAALRMKKLNLKQYQGQNSSYYYQQLIKAQSIVDKMYTFVKYYETEQIITDWKTLRMQANGSYLQGKEDYYKAIPDFLHNPLINLQSFTESSFNFSFAQDYLTAPLTATEQYYNTYITNALYFALPTLNSLREKIYNPIKYEQIEKTTSVKYLPIALIIIPVLGAFIGIYIHLYVRRIKQTSHRFLESISQQTLQSKRQKCSAFLLKYKITFIEEDSGSKNNKLSKGENPSFQGNVSKTTTKMADEYTEREMQINMEDKLQHPKDFQKQQSAISVLTQNQLVVVKRKHQTIFTPQSYVLLIILRSAHIIPFTIFCVVMLTMEQKIKVDVVNAFDGIDGTMITKLNIILLHIYSMHFGVFSPGLERFNSMINQFATIIFEMFYAIKYILTALAKQEVTDFYGNLCKLYKDVTYEGQSFFDAQGNYNYAACASIHSGILTKGFNSALLSYVQAANNLFQNNFMISYYTPEQKLEYLNSIFFTDTVKVANYLIACLQSYLFMMKEDYYNMVYGYTNYMVYASIGLFISIILGVIILGGKFIADLKQEILQTKIIYTLISCDTVVENQKLKQSFIKNEQSLKGLK